MDDVKMERLESLIAKLRAFDVERDRLPNGRRWDYRHAESCALCYLVHAGLVSRDAQSDRAAYLASNVLGIAIDESCAAFCEAGYTLGLSGSEIQPHHVAELLERARDRVLSERAA